MRVVIKEFEVYEYEELTQVAKDRAYANWLNINNEYVWDNENKYVLSKFQELFPVKATKWEYGYGANIVYTFNNSDLEDLEGVRLYKYLVNNYKDLLDKDYNECILTGYYLDVDILKPIFEYVKKPSVKSYTFDDLMRECLEAWVHACDDDYVAYFSHETFLDNTGDFEFLKDGTIFEE